jgi:hypothetical protein
MRTILAPGLSLGLLISLSAAANAATVHHHRHHVAVHSSRGTIIDSVPDPYNDQPSPYDNRFPNWGG